MSKYRKKPVIIEAIRWTGENEEEIIEFCTDKLAFISDGGFLNGHKTLFIRTPESSSSNLFQASEGDYVIKGIAGEYYACKPDIFEKTYDKID